MFNKRKYSFIYYPKFLIFFQFIWGNCIWLKYSEESQWSILITGLGYLRISIAFSKQNICKTFTWRTDKIVFESSISELQTEHLLCFPLVIGIFLWFTGCILRMCILDVYSWGEDQVQGKENPKLAWRFFQSLLLLMQSVQEVLFVVLMSACFKQATKWLLDRLWALKDYIYISFI